jgi:hypothetical protein
MEATVVVGTIILSDATIFHNIISYFYNIVLLSSHLFTGCHASVFSAKPLFASLHVRLPSAPYIIIDLMNPTICDEE